MTNLFSIQRNYVELLVGNKTNGIVQCTFTKQNVVDHFLNVHSIQNRQNSDWVSA